MCWFLPYINMNQPQVCICPTASLVAQSLKNQPAMPESACSQGHGFDPWIGKIPWRTKGNSLQYSCLGNPKDRET